MLHILRYENRGNTQNCLIIKYGHAPVSSQKFEITHKNAYNNSTNTFVLTFLFFHKEFVYFFLCIICMYVYIHLLESSIFLFTLDLIEI